MRAKFNMLTLMFADYPGFTLTFSVVAWVKIGSQGLHVATTVKKN